MAQLEHIEAIERRLWSVADTLQANSNYASNEYFLPVMGLVFLRHAYSRYLAVKDEQARTIYDLPDEIGGHVPYLGPRKIWGRVPQLRCDGGVEVHVPTRTGQQGLPPRDRGTRTLTQPRRGS